MPIPDGTKIGVSTETPSLYFDSFLIAFVVSIKTCNDSDVIFPKTILTFLCISLPSGNKIFKFHCIVFDFYIKDKKNFRIFNFHNPNQSSKDLVSSSLSISFPSGRFSHK